MDEIKKRLIKASAAVIICISIGTVGFRLVDDGQHSIVDCVFMTVITLATVGYNEVIPLETDFAKLFASILIVVGMGSLIYFGSTIIAFFVEVDLRHLRRIKKMEKKIAGLLNHVIVCGVGTTGSRVVSELRETNTPFIMIDTHQEQFDKLKENCQDKGAGLLYITGDATEDHVLEAAGIDRASGLIAALRNDKDNLYLILSARQINPKLRIIARATEESAPLKMIRAGADKVVAPNIIGGMRIASEIIRPDVVEFLDVMLRDKEQNNRIEQVVIPDDSPLVGRTLASTKIRKATDVLVIAIRNVDGKFTYNPGPDTIMEAGAVLVVLGAMESVLKLRKSISSNTSFNLIRPSTQASKIIDG